MGEYVDNLDNLMEELFEVVPVSYFLSSTFEERIQASRYGFQWNFRQVGHIINETLEGKEAAMEAKIKGMCNIYLREGAPSIYRFVSFLIINYCEDNHTQVNLQKLRVILRSIGVIKIAELEQYDSNTPFTQNIITEINKWDEMKKMVEKLESDCIKAIDTDDFRNIGNTCRNLLIRLAQLVYNPEIHGDITDRGVRIGKAHVLEMLSKYIAFKLAGDSNEEFRSYAKSSLGIANVLTHKSHATKKEMLLTASATINLVYIVGLIGDKFNNNYV